MLPAAVCPETKYTNAHRETTLFYEDVKDLLFWWDFISRASASNSTAQRGSLELVSYSCRFH